MSYSFRIGISRAPNSSLEAETEELTLPSDNPAISVKLSSTLGQQIKAASKLSLTGSGFSTAEAAEDAGTRYQDVLTVALAASRVGVDFGHRARRKSRFTEYGLKWVSENTGGGAVLNDINGLMTYETSTAPKFVSMNPEITVGRNTETFLKHWGEVTTRSPRLSVREKLSYTLFNTSFFRQSADSRLILLVMAIEALIEAEPRDQKSAALLDSFVEQAKASTLDDSEKDSIAHGLNRLKTESIGQAGRRLVVRRLGTEKTYAELTPSKFFRECYNMRSALVHGNHPYPKYSDVEALAAPLEVFVSELLIAPYLPVSS